VRAFKSSTTLRFHRMRSMSDEQLWHVNYYEHIIRNQTDWDRIILYIANNPDRWSEDRLQRSRRDSAC
jgi:REP element-mobilizing transposase RayT